MSDSTRSYLDSSALVKLVLEEVESPGLRVHLAQQPRRASCGLASVEVIRAVRREGRRAVARARVVLDRVEVLELNKPLLDAAADIEDRSLRSLDAIHVAAAMSLGEDLTELITYDRRMADVASSLGLVVSAPS